jgi:hypothetical protein
MNSVEPSAWGISDTRKPPDQKRHAKWLPGVDQCQKESSIETRGTDITVHYFKIHFTNWKNLLIRKSVSLIYVYINKSQLFRVTIGRSSYGPSEIAKKKDTVKHVLTSIQWTKYK